MSQSLIVASDELRADVDGSLPVMAGDDQINREAVYSRLRQIPDPRQWIKFERQVRNDCRAHSGTSSRENVYRFETGNYVQLSRTWFYMMCETVQGTFGRDGGTSLQAGVKVLTTGGCATEKTWPYEFGYGRMSQRSFISKSDELKTEASKFLLAGQVVSNPSWLQVLDGISRGGVVDWGVNYDMSADRNGIVSRYTGRGGGHAMFLCWATEIAGRWVVLNVNSHWSTGQIEVPRKYAFITEDYYETARRKSPYGVYLYLPAKEAEKVFSWKTAFSSLADDLRNGV